MKLTTHEEEFIKLNKEMLRGIFLKKIEELKEELLLAKSEDMPMKVSLILELKRILETINVFSQDKKDKKDNFI